MKLKTTLATGAALAAVASIGSESAFAQAQSLGAMSQATATDLVPSTVLITCACFIVALAAGANFLAGLYGYGTVRNSEHKAKHLVCSLAACGIGLSMSVLLGASARTVSGQGPAITAQNAAQVMQIQ